MTLRKSESTVSLGRSLPTTEHTRGSGKLAFPLSTEFIHDGRMRRSATTTQLRSELQCLAESIKNKSWRPEEQVYGLSRPSRSFLSVSRSALHSNLFGYNDLQIPLADVQRGETSIYEGGRSENAFYFDDTDLRINAKTLNQLEAFEAGEQNTLAFKRQQAMKNRCKKGIVGIDDPTQPETRLYKEKFIDIKVEEHRKKISDEARHVHLHYGINNDTALLKQGIVSDGVIPAGVSLNVMPRDRRSDELGVRHMGWTSRQLQPSDKMATSTKDRLFPTQCFLWNAERGARIWERERSEPVPFKDFIKEHKEEQLNARPLNKTISTHKSDQASHNRLNVTQPLSANLNYSQTATFNEDGTVNKAILRAGQTTLRQVRNHNIITLQRESKPNIRPMGANVDFCYDPFNPTKNKQRIDHELQLQREYRRNSKQTI